MTSTVDELDLQTFQVRAGEAARLLKALSNEKRLMVLCKLIETGEASVTRLSEAVGLSQSALSQHLALMREEGLVAFRRESQTVYYRVADPNVARLLGTLKTIFC